jgi:hypothetical protein
METPLAKSSRALLLVLLIVVLAAASLRGGRCDRSLGESVLAARYGLRFGEGGLTRAASVLEGRQ